MTKKNQIDTLKMFAKRHARANRVAQHESLNSIASELGFAHWAQMAGKAKQGWLPSDEQLAQAEAFVLGSYVPSDASERFIGRSLSRAIDEPIRQGKIGDHSYSVFESFGDVHMEGDGWRILVGEALLSQPIVEIEQPHATKSPAKKRDFIDAALMIVDEEAAKVRAGISSDWPRRSTKPDAEGVVLHPLFGGKSADWYCLHCDGTITGTQLAENLWHCPGCGASPIDIFPASPELDGSDGNSKPVQIFETRQRPEPKVQVVDSRPTLSLNEESISMLLRSALLEDAETSAERLGALLAEIYVDEDGDACIVLDEDLWPSLKEPDAAIAVAELLGIELELNETCMSFPFAWPGLGHVTTSTPEYVQLLLEAHQEKGVIRRTSKKE